MLREEKIGKNVAKIFSHDGGECPTSPNALVSYRCDTQSKSWHVPVKASRLRWIHVKKSTGNIIEYRIVR